MNPYIDPEMAVIQDQGAMPTYVALCRPDIAEEFGVRIADMKASRPLPAVGYLREDVARMYRGEGVRMTLRLALHRAEAVANTDANMSQAYRNGAAEVARCLRELAAEMGVTLETR